MSRAVTRHLSAYDGRTFIGSLKITRRDRRCPSVKASDRCGKTLGTFTSQKAGMGAISRAYAKQAGPAAVSGNPLAKNERAPRTAEIGAFADGARPHG
jgi:hypothetical protein